jgi:hypothetical protein
MKPGNKMILQSLFKKRSYCFSFEMGMYVQKSLTEELVTLQQLNQAMNCEQDYLYPIFNKNGYYALRENLISMDQILSMPPDYSAHLFGNVYGSYYADRTVYGLEALRKRLITPRQIRNMPNALYLKYLFCSETGIKALEEGLITPEEIAQMPDENYVYTLFCKLVGFSYAANPIGSTALRKNLITPNQIQGMPDAGYLFYLFEDEYGIKALEEGLITIEYIKDLPTCEHLYDYLRNLREDDNRVNASMYSNKEKSIDSCKTFNYSAKNVVTSRDKYVFSVLFMIAGLGMTSYFGYKCFSNAVNNTFKYSDMNFIFSVVGIVLFTIGILFACYSCNSRNINDQNKKTQVELSSDDCYFSPLSK